MQQTFERQATGCSRHVERQATSLCEHAWRDETWYSWQQLPVTLPRLPVALPRLPVTLPRLPVTLPGCQSLFPAPLVPDPRLTAIVPAAGPRSLDTFSHPIPGLPSLSKLRPVSVAATVCRLCAAHTPHPTPLTQQPFLPVAGSACH
eukprot:363864-Chlamydomonas_euryale.AAC.1